MARISTTYCALVTAIMICGNFPGGVSSITCYHCGPPNKFVNFTTRCKKEEGAPTNKNTVECSGFITQCYAVRLSMRKGDIVRGCISNCLEQIDYYDITKNGFISEYKCVGTSLCNGRKLNKRKAKCKIQ